jgi:glycosyltransferase involved in cell wall biosynthesis
MNIRSEAQSSQPVWNDVGIIALVPDEWDPQWQTRHQVMSRLARYFHVVWVNQPHRWWDCFSVLTSRRRLGADNPAAPANFEVYRPEFWLPLLGRPARLAAFTSRQRLARARARLRAQGCTRMALYVFRPDFGSVLEHIQHDLSIYHIDDEYSFSTTETGISPAERNLLEAAGQVFIHSPAMLRKKGHLNPHTEFVPNGVDFKLYATPVPEPEDLREIPHPRIGYVGTMKRMVDWELLLELSADRPQWSFVFIGPKAPHPAIDDLLHKMRERPNVHFLDAKPTDRLGSYLQHFDVCTMPYRVDNYTKYIYPLKMHEYLASGKPVVSAPISSVEEFGDVITLAKTREEWLRAIDHALSSEENAPRRRAERQEVAGEYDWDVIADRIAGTIARHLGIEAQKSIELSSIGNQAISRVAAESSGRVKR